MILFLLILHTAFTLESHSKYSFDFVQDRSKIIDYSSEVYTEIFDEKGNKIGEDKDGEIGNIMIITDKDLVLRIKNNTTQHLEALGEDLTSGVHTTKTIIEEALHVLERTIKNGGLREEISAITMDGEIIRGKTGKFPFIKNGSQHAESAEIKIPVYINYREITIIHSHPTTTQVIGNTAYPQTTTNPSTDDLLAFPYHDANIIVGNIRAPSLRIDKEKVIVGHVPKGASFYNDRDPQPKVTLSVKAMKKMLVASN